MAIIGQFRRDGETWNGYIATVRLDIDGVSLVPNPLKGESDNGRRLPDFLLKYGRVEMGAGWLKTSSGNGSFISIEINDPTVPCFDCTLFPNEDGTANLVYYPPRTRN
jgi:uncharacterized protein (DUF736 family)